MMFGQFFYLVSRNQLPARAGWSDVVKSMEAAFSDPKHIIILGVIAGSIIVVYANYRVARWIERKSEHHE